MTLKLTVQHSSRGAVRSVTFDQETVVVGRAPDCEIRLPFSTVSSHHLQFTKRGQQHLVADLGSTNGTRANGHRLPAGQFLPVHDGMILHIVDLTLQLTLPETFAGGFTLAESATLLRQMVGEALRIQGDSDDDLPFIEILSGPGSGRRLRISDDMQEAWFGTDPDCTWTLDDPAILPRAFRIHLDQEYFRIDVCPDAQVKLNGESLAQEATLHSKDRIIAGSVELLFYDPLQAYLHELDKVDAGPADVVEGASDVGELPAQIAGPHRPTEQFSASDVLGMKSADDLPTQSGDSEGADRTETPPLSTAAAPERRDSPAVVAQHRKQWGPLEVVLMIVSITLLVGGTTVLLYVFGVL